MGCPVKALENGIGVLQSGQDVAHRPVSPVSVHLDRIMWVQGYAFHNTSFESCTVGSTTANRKVVHCFVLAWQVRLSICKR